MEYADARPAPAVGQPRGADWLTVPILCALLLAYWAPRLSGPMDMRSDSAVYYILGTSIAEGHGYRLLNEPGAIQAVQYPPGFPLVAAAHQWLLGTSDPVVVAPWLRLTSCAFFVAFMLASYALLRAYLSPWIALLGTTLCMLQVETFLMSELFYPEVLYALLTMAFLLVCARGRSTTSGVLAGLLATAAFLVRSVGLALLLAWVIESLCNGRYRQALARAGVALIPVVAWQGYVAHVVSGSEYSHPAYAYQRASYMFYNVTYGNNILTYNDPMAPELGRASMFDLAARVVTHAMLLPEKFGEAVSSTRVSYELPWKIYHLPAPFSTPWPVGVCLFILGIFVTAGLALMVLKRQWLLTSYVVLSLGIMCVTPWPQQFDRYLMPIEPLLMACFLSAFVASTRLPGVLGKSSRALFVVVIVLVLTQQLLWMQIIYRSRKPSEFRNARGESILYRDFFFLEPYRALDRATDWLRTHAKADEVCASSMPHGIYMRAGIPCVMSPFEPDPAQAQALLDSVPVTYLVVDEGLALDTSRYMSQVVRAFPEQWRQQYTTEIPPEPGRDVRGSLSVYMRTALPTPGGGHLQGQD